MAGLFRILAPLCLLGLSACHSVRPQAGNPPPAPVAQVAQEGVAGTVRGVLRQTGNHPHIECVVTGHSEPFGKGEYRVVGSRLKEISALPLGPITVTGKLRRLVVPLAGNSGITEVWLLIDVSSYTR